MPSAANLHSLKVLVEQLEAIATARPGQPVSSQNWNDIVNAIIKLANTMQSGIDLDRVPIHEHHDQVGLGWLEPKLRQLVEQGPLSDPATRARLLDIERRLKILQRQFEAMEGSVKDVRQRIDDTVTRDLEREADATDIRRKFDVLSESGDNILQLRESLQALESQLEVALKLSDIFDVGGEVPDFQELESRLRAVEGLFSRYTVNDKLLDAKAILALIEELRNDLVTEEELREVIGADGLVISDSEKEQLTEDIRATLQSENEAELSNFREGINDQLEERFSTIDARVSNAVAESQDELSASILGSIREETQQENERLNAQIAELTQSNNSLNSQLLLFRQQTLSALANADRNRKELEDSLREEIKRLGDEGRGGLVINPSDSGTGGTGLSGRTLTTPALNPDELTELSGIGPSIEKRLNDRGISTFSQLADMDTRTLARLIGRSERVAKSIIENARRRV